MIVSLLDSISKYSYLTFVIELDECESQPCQNEAACTDLVGSYECSCQAGYAGTVCENSKSNFLFPYIQRGISNY